MSHSRPITEYMTMRQQQQGPPQPPTSLPLATDNAVDLSVPASNAVAVSAGGPTQQQQHDNGNDDEVCDA